MKNDKCQKSKKKAPGKYEILGGRRTTRFISGSRWIVVRPVKHILVLTDRTHNIAKLKSPKQAHIRVILLRFVPQPRMNYC